MTDIDPFPPGGPRGPDIGTTTTTLPRNRPGTTTSTTTTLAPTTTSSATTTTQPRASTTTTTQPRLGPAPASSPTTTVPLFEPDQQDLDSMVAQSEAFIEGRSTSVLTDNAIDQRFLYPSAPLGFRPATVPVQTQWTETVGEIDVVRSSSEYYLDPALIQAPLVDRIQGEIEGIRTQIAELPADAQNRATRTALQTRVNNYLDFDQGEKFATELSVLQALNAMSIDQLRMFKGNLQKVGLLDAGDEGDLFSKDINDATWEAALLLGEKANTNGMRYMSFLDYSVGMGLTFDKPRTSPTGPRIPPVRITSRQDIGATANQVALRQIGRQLSQPELDAFVTSYNQMERDFHRQYYANAVEVEDAPSVQAASEEMVTSEFQTEEEVYKMGSVLDSFTRLMGGVG